jgi:hypothetical protein
VIDGSTLVALLRPRELAAIADPDDSMSRRSS